MREKKTPSGECDCPLKGCDERIPVFKYAGDLESNKRRFAGRLYGICPTHGRIENHEYFLCHAKLKTPANDASDASASHASNASPVSQKPPAAPKAATQPAPKSKQPSQPKQPETRERQWWEPIIR